MYPLTLPSILLSSLLDLTVYNLERTITINGTLKESNKALEELMTKIMESYESDMAAMNVSIFIDIETLFPST